MPIFISETAIKASNCVGLLAFYLEKKVCKNPCINHLGKDVFFFKHESNSFFNKHLEEKNCQAPDTDFVCIIQFLGYACIQPEEKDVH